MSNIRKKIFIGIFCAIFALFMGQSMVHAQSDDIVTNPKGFLDKFGWGGDVVIGQEVNGDVHMVVDSITINAPIKGNLVIFASEDININASIEGAVILVSAKNISIMNNIGSNAYLAGDNIKLGKDSVIGGRLYLASESAALNGSLMSRLYTISTEVLFNGELKDNAFLLGSEISFGENALIDGHMHYESEQEQNISEQYILGGISFANDSILSIKFAKRGFHVAGFIWKLFSMFVIGLLLITLWPKTIKNGYEIVKKSSAKVALIGLVSFILIPLSFVVLTVTLIGIPLAVIIIFSFTAVLIIAKTFFAIYLGLGIFEYKKSKQGSNKSSSKKLKDSPRLMWIMVSGIIVLQVVSYIPYIGRFISFLAIIIGIGSILWLFKRSFQIDKV